MHFLDSYDIVMMLLRTYDPYHISYDIQICEVSCSRPSQPKPQIIRLIAELSPASSHGLMFLLVPVGGLILV